MKKYYEHKTLEQHKSGEEGTKIEYSFNPKFFYKETYNGIRRTFAVLSDVFNSGACSYRIEVLVGIEKLVDCKVREQEYKVWEDTDSSININHEETGTPVLVYNDFDYYEGEHEMVEFQTPGHGFVTSLHHPMFELEIWEHLSIGDLQLIHKETGIDLFPSLQEEGINESLKVDYFKEFKWGYHSKPYERS